MSLFNTGPSARVDLQDEIDRYEGDHGKPCRDKDDILLWWKVS
jgi:hypothetical protein